MPLRELLAVDDRTAQWSVWGTTARVVVTDRDHLGEAADLIERELAAVDAVASRFRPDSELITLRTGRPVRISPLLAELIEAGLLAARRTDGDVDPTLASALASLGYDRDFDEIGDSVTVGSITVRPAPDWRRIRLEGLELTLPSGTRLDLGATAKAYTADRGAELVARTLGTGVLVSLGGDIATAGPAPAGGWRVFVSDGPGEPASTISIPAGAAVATSSTIARTWRHNGQPVHHILDPRSGQPAKPVWRTVSVGAWRCVEANAYATASIVRGATAVGWLRGLHAPARLVNADRAVRVVGGWPAEVRGD
jgi:thiamine biosynthesis lipoprotein